MKTRIINFLIVCIFVTTRVFAQNSQTPNTGTIALPKSENIDPKWSYHDRLQSNYFTNRLGYNSTNGFRPGGITNNVSANPTNMFGKGTMTNGPSSQDSTNKHGAANNIGAYSYYTNSSSYPNSTSDSSNRSSTYKNPYAVDPRTISGTGTVTN